MPRHHFFLITMLFFLPACGQRENHAQAEVSILPSLERSIERKPVAPDSLNQDSTWDVHYLTGRFDPASHPEFTKIKSIHTSKQNIYLRKDVYAAFEKMFEAAKKEGVILTIISATRNFDYQKGIWEKKWMRDQYKGWTDQEKVAAILKYSSMPGTSRHHWGTDVDFNSVDPDFFASGQGKKIYVWLVNHASDYGFAQTYTNKANGRSGYEEEKWHWSYMPVSSEMLKAFNTQVKYADMKGFSGSNVAEELKVFELYVNGIDTTLK